MCVTNFRYILLEIQVHSVVCVLVFSKSVVKITFQQFIVAAFLVVLGPFWLYEQFDDRYQKRLCQSPKKTSVTIIIKAFITAYGSAAQDLAAKIH